MNTTEKADLLHRTTLFSSLGGEELADLAEIASERRFPPGQTVIWEGDPPDWFYIVVQGKIKIIKHTSLGKELIVAIFDPPNIFGEVAVFDGIPYPASAVSIDESILLGIRRDEILAFLGRNPSIALKIINMLGGRLREAHARLRDMAGERVEQRLANMLLMLSSRLGQNIPFTRQEIAGMTGMTTETVIRNTTRLKDEGVISTTRGEIQIINESKLRQIAEGDHRE